MYNIEEVKKRKKVRVSAIAAIGKNREIGKNNDLIWRISSDLKRVKSLTTGHTIIMGRKTYESIGRPLPNRINIVVSESVTEIEGCVVCASLDEALGVAIGLERTEVFIFGGARVYTEALPHVDRLYLTMIDAEDLDADVFFPEYERDFTHVISRESMPAENNTPPYTLVVCER